MIILGIDPGTSRVGWGLIQTKPNYVVIDYGCIENKSTTAIEKRLEDIYKKITQIIKNSKPDAIAIEDLYFASNAKTAITVGQARGVLILASQLMKIEAFSYTPLQVKQAVSGSGRAEKKQVQQMVKSILHLNIIPKPDDAADALAIALTHAFSYKMGKLL